jgi:hypothetical protein
LLKRGSTCVLVGAASQPGQADGLQVQLCLRLMQACGWCQLVKQLGIFHIVQSLPFVSQNKTNYAY